MRVAAGPPTAEPQIDALYVGGGALSVLLVSVLHCSGVSVRVTLDTTRQLYRVQTVYTAVACALFGLSITDSV